MSGATTTEKAESNGFCKPEDLFKPLKRRYTEVQVDGLGKFRLRSLTAGEFQAWAVGKNTSSGGYSRMGAINANVKLIIMCCVDADGDLIFTKEHIQQLQELPVGPVAELFTACLEHCGLADDEGDAKN